MLNDPSTAFDISIDPAANPRDHDWVSTLMHAHMRLCRALSRGEQGRPEDEAAEAAETGTATPARSLATAPIPEHSVTAVHQNGTGPSAADLSSLAGADVSLTHGGMSPQSAGRDFPAASVGGHTGLAADVSSPAELSGSDPSLAAANPSIDTAAGLAGGAAVAGNNEAAAGAGVSTASISAAGSATDIRRSVTLNPLFEPDAANDGPPPQAASSSDLSPEPSLQADKAQAAAASAASDGAPGAPQSSGQALGEGSGHVRVRHRGNEAHPSILRHSTWTDPETAATRSDAD